MGIDEVFGVYEYHGYVLQILFAEVIFIPLLLRRERFILRFAIAFPLYLVVSWVGTNLIHFVIPELVSFSIFLFSFALGVFLFSNRTKSLLFVCAGAQLIQNLAHNIEGVIFLPLADHFNTLGRFFLSVGVMVVVYIIAYFVIVRRMEDDIESVVPARGAFLFSLFSVLLVYVIQTLLRKYEPRPHWVIVLPLIFCDLMTLSFCFFFVSYMGRKYENRELERIVSQSDEHYAFVAANIEAINLKAHDLKHFIDNSAKMDSEGLRELEKEVLDYEMTAKTGIKALDNVLTNYILICHKENISLSFSVDPNSLSFMKPSDLASMFGNLLSNSLEAERKIIEKEKRFISFKASKKAEMVSIHFENYWPYQIAFKKGVPMSTKGDPANHGYGIKSISYVANKYGGAVSFLHESDVFETNILFPKQDEEAR